MIEQLRRSNFFWVVVATALIVFWIGICTAQKNTSPCISNAAKLLFSSSLTTQNSHSLIYEWGNIPIEGMGFVTGLAIHPNQPDRIYARTDVGGVFRWDEESLQWTPLMDQFGRSQRSYYNIESIALDPNDADVIYAAVGAYTREGKGEILKSIDRGENWTSTHLKTPDGNPVRMGGNQEWRWAGERLAVDPNNSKIVYFGSRLDGIYRSFDAAKTWQKVAGFPNMDASEITFVLFDRHSNYSDRYHSGSRSQSASQTIYVGLLDSGVYRSEDAGTTWQKLSPDLEETRNPQQAILSRNGTLYVTFFASPGSSGGGVWKFERGQWTNITPVLGKNYTAIAADPNAETLMVAEYPLTPEGVHRSIDGGKTWQPIKLNVQTPSWWPNWHLYTLMGALAIDPHHPKRVWLTNGFGVLRTDDITANPSNWSACMANLEELVTFVVKSPPLPGGAVLFSGVADMDGFRHASLNTVPMQTYDRGTFGDTTGIDFSEADPNIVVRVGSSPGSGGREDSQGRSAYSNDNGQTWQPFRQTPAVSANGKVAVSAILQPNGYPIIVWAPQGDIYPHRSLDGGKTWLPVEGAPNRTTLQLWFPSQAIAADRVDGNTFYLYKYGEAVGGSFYRSTNGGANWERTITGLPDHWLHAVKAAPGLPGEVWLSTHGNPLYRSSDAGKTFTPIAQVQQADEFAFGKAAPGHINPTVFVYGVVNQTEGLFRSDDATHMAGDAAAATWVKVSSDRQRLGNLTYLEGDRLVFGRVYAGTGGRGIFYGEPQ